MTTATQHRRGTTSEHSTFTGLEGEITVDTTKDTAVVHDGSTAGGLPLARENLANVTTSGLSSINGADTASDDKFFIYDQSATVLKTITRAELNNAIEQDALASVAITGGTINGTSVGATTASSGAFTTLSSTGNTTLGDASGDTVTINGTATFANANPTLSAGTANGVLYLNGSKVATSGSALTFDGTLFNNTSAAPNIRATVTGGAVYTTLASDGVYSTGTDMYLLAPASKFISFYANNSEQMRLNSTGLGIGTSSPDAGAKLTVAGGILTTGSFSATTGSTAGIDYNGGNQRFFSMGSSGSTKGGYLWIAKGADGSSSSPMTLDSSGNLGLGVTPSAWRTTGGEKAIQVGPTLTAYSNSGGDVYWNKNWYLNSSAQSIYLTNGYAQSYGMINGEHSWYISPNGTAGNTISFTQAATLTASGNFLVGTTSSLGDLSSNAKIVGGSFTTRQATTASLANAATEDITGLISGAAYLAVCKGDSNTTTFVIHTVYVNGAGGVTLATLSNGNGFVLTSPSANTLRVTGLVTTQTYTYSLTRIF